MLELMPYYIYFVLLATFAMFNLTQAQTGGTLSIAPHFLPDPTTIHYIAGGNQAAAARFGAGCQGFIEQQPDHILNLQSDFDYLQVKVESAKDTMLVIVHSSSQEFWCDDDSAGEQNPRIARENWRAGEYQIFVGGYARGDVADYVLSVSEYRLEFSDFKLSESDPFHIQLRRNFSPDPLERSFAAGGERNATEIFGADCVGYIAEEADFVLEVLEPLPYLRIYVESAADTTLVLQPEGSARAFCDDDSNGLNPQFIASFAAGRYHIYIGLQTPQQDASYKLFLSEYAPARED